MGVAGVILAGGRSSRMGGGDKALLPLGDRPILAHVIERLAPQVEHLAISANGDPARFAKFALPVVADATAELKGPLAGLLAGLEWARGLLSVSHLATVAADTPFFPRDVAERLAEQAEGADRVVMAASGGRPHPVFALWPLSLHDELSRHLASGGSLKVLDFAAQYGTVCVDFPVAGTDDFDPFFNVNTPEDMALARSRMERRP